MELSINSVSKLSETVKTSLILFYFYFLLRRQLTTKEKRILIFLCPLMLQNILSQYHSISLSLLRTGQLHIPSFALHCNCSYLMISGITFHPSILANSTHFGNAFLTFFFLVKSLEAIVISDICSSLLPPIVLITTLYCLSYFMLIPTSPTFLCNAPGHEDKKN